MFSLFKGIFASVTAKEEVKILLIGPDGSGKSVETVSSDIHKPGQGSNA